MFWLMNAYNELFGTFQGSRAKFEIILWLCSYVLIYCEIDIQFQEK